MALIPKNWTEFQHYKDRAPVWIKLHRKLLDDYTFSRLPVASRALAPLLWLLASEYDEGKITASVEELSFRLRLSARDFAEALNPLISSGFFASDSKPLAKRKRVSIPEREEETQEKRREETDSRAVAGATRTEVCEKDFEDFWKVYPKRDGANPKAHARKSFLRLLGLGVEAPRIIAAARECAAKDRDKIGTAYIPQAVTWLNQKRFEDYQPIPEADSTGPPKPPSPELPTHEELLRKYARKNDETKAGEGLRGEGNGVLRGSPGGEGQSADDQPGQPGMGGVEDVLH